jgi:cytochrome c oxidase subunit 1
MGYLGIHYWWPKIRASTPSGQGGAAVVIFLGFSTPTFFPQSSYYSGCRASAAYPQVQVLNVMSTAGASILGVGYLLPLVYLTWSMRYGKKAGDNPWKATGLEWQTSSPPPVENFLTPPVVTEEAYAYATPEAAHV